MKNCVLHCPAVCYHRCMLQQAVFAAGCFWGVEEVFRTLPGVESTRVGYTGGNLPDPTYEMVCTDTTGHAEAVEVTYDPAVISYDRLLDVFFGNHNPTTPNQQGPDFGSQYRSAIFCVDDAQRVAAERAIARLQSSGAFPRPIVTQVLPSQPFYEAEDYHQKYLFKRGRGSCHV